TPRTKPGGVTAVALRPWGRNIVEGHRKGRLRRTRKHVAEFFASLLGIEKLADPETPELRAWETFAVQTEMTKQFNCEALELEHGEDARERLNDSLKYLFDDPTDQPAGVVARAHGVRVVPRWCGLYAIADSLALAWQRRFQRDWRVLFLLG